MRCLRLSFWGAVLLSLWPALVWACAYPLPLRHANTTLLAALDGGGTVTIHQREALRRVMAQVSPDVLKRQLRQEVARRDARAAGVVIDTAVALASGRGMTVAPNLRDDVARLGQAVKAACLGQASVAGKGEAAQSVEHGTARSEGDGGRALTFREGVTRLSITFTIYLVFMAFVLGIRRTIKERARLSETTEQDQAGDVELT